MQRGRCLAVVSELARGFLRWERGWFTEICQFDISREGEAGQQEQHSRKREKTQGKHNQALQMSRTADTDHFNGQNNESLLGGFRAPSVSRTRFSGCVGDQVFILRNQHIKGHPVELGEVAEVEENP